MNEFRSYSDLIKVVMRNPLKKKNTVTPKPPGTYSLSPA
jgi:hypothetical protein